MLLELFLAGYFNYKDFIYDNSLSLGLTPNDALILIYILNEYQKGNKKIDLEKMEHQVLLHKNDINNSLSNLLENAFYNVCLVNKDGVLEEEITIEPFFKKVEDFYTPQHEDTNKKIFTLIERKSQKLLTASDYENINNLIVSENYGYEDFKETIAYLEKAKLDITIRNIMKYIDKKTPTVAVDDATSQTIQDLLKAFRKQNE